MFKKIMHSIQKYTDNNEKKCLSYNYKFLTDYTMSNEPQINICMYVHPHTGTHTLKFYSYLVNSTFLLHSFPRVKGIKLIDVNI